MKTAWRCIVLSALMLLVTGCAISPESRDAKDDLATRASEEMAPPNPSRGSKTIRVTTRVPSELEVRLVTFYSQFHPHLNVNGQWAPREGKVANACWWTRSSMLQEEHFYYTRVFYYPVGNGTSTQDLVLDEVIPGTCHIGITGIGYEVALREPKGKPVSRYLVRFDISVEDGGVAAADAAIQCNVNQAHDGKTSALRCKRERQSSNAIHLGPLATSGATLTLDFRLAGLTP